MKPTLEEFDDQRILSELKKLKYTYGLNKVIRYNFKRIEEHQTQSVAEHVCSMLFLAHYFRPLEDPDNTLDFERVVRMIIMHDMGEIETGDILMVAKTDDHEREERQALANVIAQSPTFVAEEIENFLKILNTHKRVKQNMPKQSTSLTDNYSGWNQMLSRWLFLQMKVSAWILG